MYKLKYQIISAVILGLLVGCNDYVSQPIYSTDGKYSLIAKVNRTESSDTLYAEPVFEIFSEETKTKIGVIHSGVGDFNKWNVSWSDSASIVLLISSDVGMKTWEITDSTIIELETNLSGSNQN